MLVHLKNENFSELVSGKKVLVDFYADWCGPCKMLGPVLEEVANETDCLVVKVNTDEHGELASQFGVRSIPALFLLEDGKVVNNAVGFMPKAKVLSFIDQK